MACTISGDFAPTAVPEQAADHHPRRWCGFSEFVRALHRVVALGSPVFGTPSTPPQAHHQVGRRAAVPQPAGLRLVLI